ncbi:hypothetical protein MBLNU13_g01076t1 [Cladosporium sp. NU13]
MATDMCVAVGKYSHAIGVKPDNTIPWTHVAATDLFLVLKGEDTHIQNGQLILQVIQGNSALETVDVAEYVDRALEARYGSQQAGITPQIEQLPIFGIHKEVFLALRYRLTDGQARRVQFRLQSAQECSQMVGILERRGMEFQQQRPGTGRPASARSDADGVVGRPLTTQTYSNKSTFGVPAVPKPSPFNLQTLEAGGLSARTTVGARRTSDADQTTSRLPSTIHTTDNIRPPPSFRMPTIDANHSVPGPVQTGLDKTALGGARSDVAYDFDNAGKSQMTSSPARPATTSLYQPSAPASLRLPDTLEHEMPPRRELPFKRPGSHQSASSRPSTSANSASQSTAGADSSAPTVAFTLSPTRDSNTHRPAIASPLKRGIAPSHLEPVKKALAVGMRPQTQGSLCPSASSPQKPTAVSTNDGSFRRPSDLGELLRISKPLSERSPNSNKVVRMDSTADAQYELETPPGTSSSLTKTYSHVVVSSSPKRIDGHAATTPSQPNIYAISGPSTKAVDPLVRASSVVQGPVDGADSALADYASQSREDRQAVLDEFMVSKLEDPNFAVLCEDLDSCWRRIALGL